MYSPRLFSSTSTLFSEATVRKGYSPRLHRGSAFGANESAPARKGFVGRLATGFADVPRFMYPILLMLVLGGGLYSFMPFYHALKKAAVDAVEREQDLKQLETVEIIRRSEEKTWDPQIAAAAIARRLFRVSDADVESLLRERFRGLYRPPSEAEELAAQQEVLRGLYREDARAAAQKMARAQIKIEELTARRDARRKALSSSFDATTGAAGQAGDLVTTDGLEVPGAKRSPRRPVEEETVTSASSGAATSRLEAEQAYAKALAREAKDLMRLDLEEQLRLEPSLTRIGQDKRFAETLRERQAAR